MESNQELELRRLLLYPFNYRDVCLDYPPGRGFHFARTKSALLFSSFLLYYLLLYRKNRNGGILNLIDLLARHQCQTCDRGNNDCFSHNVLFIKNAQAHNRSMSEQIWIEGFEPTTSTSQMWRSTKLSYIQSIFVLYHINLNCQ